MIDTEALRKKVIDLAIQGKLTEHLPSDGDAETLYAKIVEQKSQLIKEGKIKKDKQLSEVTYDEIPFEIPNNWKWVRLRDICKKIVDGDHNPPSGVKEKTEYLMLSAQNINNDRIENLESARYLSKNVFLEENKRTNLEIGDVLLTIVATLGRSCVYREKYNVCFQRSVCVISTLILPEYLKRVFDSGYIQKLMQDGATGAAQPGFYLNKVEKICVPLPPLEEQKRIAEKIESILIVVNHMNEFQKKYRNDLAVLKGKIIDAGIRGKLTEQLPEDGDVEDVYAQILKEKDSILESRGGRKDKSIKIEDEEKPFEIPNTWKWVRFGEVGLFKKGPFGSALTKSMFIPKSNEAVKVYEQQHAIKKDAALGTYYISREYFESNMSGFEVKSGDIIISCAGTIGETYILPAEIEQGIINQALMRVTLVPSIDKKFFLLYFDSNLKTNAQNESNGMAIKNIPPFDVMKNWYFPLPPVAEQKRIVDRIYEVFKLLE